MVIIGVDPGTAITGYGIIKKSKRNLKCLTWGTIETSAFLPDGERLKKLQNQLNKLIKKYKPKLLAVEKIYFFKNIKTAIPVAQAKGIVLLTAAKKKIPVYEFTPLQVKTTICGYGRADKKQIQRMIKKLLNLKKLPQDDAADALGIAICCAGITH